jgi:cytochrome P450
MTATLPAVGSTASPPSPADNPAGPAIIRGAAALPWVLRYRRDPLECLGAALASHGPLVMFEKFLPGLGDRKYLLAVGEQAHRETLSQPDLFRTGGQVMLGPKGSAHQRIRKGIFAMNWQTHREHRRLLQPPVQKSEVIASVGGMARLIDEVIDRWTPGTEVDMYREMRTLSNWVAASLLFGNDDFESSLAIGAAIEHWLLLDVEARQSPLPFDLPGTAARRLFRQSERLETMMRQLLAVRRGKGGRDLFSVAIEAADKGLMTEQDAIAHAVILYAASFETTANALAWTVFLLSQHPDVARDLSDEVGGVDCWPLSMAEVDAMPLLGAVVREGLRLMPPVAYTVRSPTQAVEFCGFPLHPGTKIFLNHYHTHRDPDVFHDPHRFRPDRWLTSNPGPYQYVPFSAGPRLCMGYLFALTELKMAIARIVQRFRTSVVPGSSIDASVQLTLRPRDGIPMTVHPQDRGYAAVPIRGNVNGMVTFDT